MAEKYGARASESYRYSMAVVRRVFIPVLIACLSTGCAGVLYSPLGKVVPEEYRIPIAGDGEQSSVWSNTDLTLEYQYRRNQDTLSISGVVHFASRIEYNFLLVTYFHMDVVFSDAQGRAVGVQPLMSAFGKSRSEDDQPFSRSLILPHGTAFMAFSYTGEAVNPDPDETPLHFWHYPVF